jgi:hypothetical protein
MDSRSAREIAETKRLVFYNYGSVAADIRRLREGLPSPQQGGG